MAVVLGTALEPFIRAHCHVSVLRGQGFVSSLISLILTPRGCLELRSLEASRAVSPPDSHGTLSRETPCAGGQGRRPEKQADLRDTWDGSMAKPALGLSPSGLGSEIS